MADMVVIETYEGEKLIERIVDKPQNLVTPYDEIFGSSAFDGVWLQRSVKLSFIAHDSIKAQRAATVFDREEIQPTW